METEISSCVPRFPLILTAKFHSLYVEESEVGVGNFGKVGIGYFTSDSATLVQTSVASIESNFVRDLSSPKVDEKCG